ncbi:MAG: type II toxin-antitoxin system VapC family toxin [Spirochaetes bacterium]|nr:type II toxin-antitoxin system VapC family toxin [Spirochaetota bacterium]
MKLLADANIFMAVILNEPEKVKIVETTHNAEIISPVILPYEIGNALSAINKQKKLSKDEIHKCYYNYKLIPVRLVEVDIKDALEIALKYDIYAYDAYYLELAKRFKICLLTLDQKMIEIAEKMNLSIQEVK